MDNDLSVPRDKIVGVFSLAKSMQELNERGDLERFVSNLPVRQDNGDGIPIEALCETGESLRLEPQYIQKAARFFSGSRNGTFEALRELGASPSIGLRTAWLGEFAEAYGKLVIEYLNNETDPNLPFKVTRRSYNPFEFQIKIGYREKDDRSRIARWLVLENSPRTFHSGVLVFWDSRDREVPVSANITASAFTLNMLNLFSRPIRELTLQISEVNSYEPTYHDLENGDCIGDPY
jgi:hypothetical protein